MPMNSKSKYSNVGINLLLAIAMSLVVNFSYLVMLLVGWPFDKQTDPPRGPLTEQSEMINRFKAYDTSADSLAVSRATERPLPKEIIIREESLIQSRRHRHHTLITEQHYTLFAGIDMLFYAIVAMLMLSVMTHTSQRTNKSYLSRVVMCLIIVVLSYIMAPQLTWRGDILITLRTQMLIHPMTMLKLLTVFFISMLYGRIYELVYKNRQVEIENERLKNENLSWQYNVLVGQVNPHFLFNSLSSLSMLIREQKDKDALTYIDQMSDTYRYIITEGSGEMTSVESELRFLEAYKYLLEIRYQGKLHINVDIPPSLNGYKLPPLSLQPLIENAVKHNTITTAHPLNIDIKAQDDEWIVVSNTINPKMEPEKSTGIGLKNLSHRYLLLTNREIAVEEQNGRFVVKLPILH